ncbi:hypothetical protein BS78_05G169100 [Paspalum vaginatum]|nr:hypothetical protein BS78_05G169100 [Paspalum vaginatum]
MRATASRPAPEHLSGTTHTRTRRRLLNHLLQRFASIHLVVSIFFSPILEATATCIQYMLIVTEVVRCRLMCSNILLSLDSWALWNRGQYKQIDLGDHTFLYICMDVRDYTH